MCGHLWTTLMSSFMHPWQVLQSFKSALTQIYITSLKIQPV